MIPGCDTCKHWDGWFRCTAYPKGIPWPIMAGDVSHLEPIAGTDRVPDDNGIVYEPIDEAKGGGGSGNFGHAGRPGKRGGSAQGGGHAAKVNFSVTSTRQK